MIFCSIVKKALIISNVLLLAFCVCTLFFNIVNVKFHNNAFVSSSCGNNHFKYTLDGGNFEFYKNDQLVWSLSGGDGIKFSHGFIPFTCNAGVAAIARLSTKNKNIKIKDAAIGAAATTAATVADIVLPGAACLDASLGGAGVLAGEIAATTGAVTIGSVLGPVAVAAAGGIVLG